MWSYTRLVNWKSLAQFLPPTFALYLYYCNFDSVYLCLCIWIFGLVYLYFLNCNHVIAMLSPYVLWTALHCSCPRCSETFNVLSVLSATDSGDFLNGRNMTLQIFVELCKNSYNTHNQNSAFAFAFTVFAFVFKLVAEYTIPQHHFKLSIFCKLSAILKILVTLTVLWVVVTLSDKWLCLKTELQLLQ